MLSHVVKSIEQIYPKSCTIPTFCQHMYHHFPTLLHVNDAGEDIATTIEVDYIELKFSTNFQSPIIITIKPTSFDYASIIQALHPCSYEIVKINIHAFYKTLNHKLSTHTTHVHFEPVSSPYGSFSIFKCEEWQLHIIEKRTIRQQVKSIIHLEYKHMLQLVHIPENLYRHVDLSVVPENETDIITGCYTKPNPSNSNAILKYHGCRDISLFWLEHFFREEDRCLSRYLPSRVNPYEQVLHQLHLNNDLALFQLPSIEPTDEDDIITKKEAVYIDNYVTSYSCISEQINKNSKLGLGDTFNQDIDQEGLPESVCIKFYPLIVTSDGFRKFFDPISLSLFAHLFQIYDIHHWSMYQWPCNTFIGSCKIHFMGCHNGEEPLYYLVPRLKDVNGMLTSTICPYFFPSIQRKWVHKFVEWKHDHTLDVVSIIKKRVLNNHEYLRRNNFRYDVNRLLLQWLEQATYLDKKTIHYLRIQSYLIQEGLRSEQITEDVMYINDWISSVRVSWKELLQHEYTGDFTIDDVQMYLRTHYPFSRVSYEDVEEWLLNEYSLFKRKFDAYAGEFEIDCLAVIEPLVHTRYRTFAINLITEDLIEKARVHLINYIPERISPKEIAGYLNLFLPQDKVQLLNVYIKEWLEDMYSEEYNELFEQNERIEAAVYLHPQFLTQAEKQQFIMEKFSLTKEEFDLLNEWFELLE